MCPVCLLGGGGDTTVDDQTISGDGLHVSGKASETEQTPSITEKPGSVLGPYKLLQQIGEGAFGVAFMAEQREPIKRKVALKIIKPGMVI